MSAWGLAAACACHDVINSPRIVFSLGITPPKEVRVQVLVAQSLPDGVYGEVVQPGFGHVCYRNPAIVLVCPVQRHLGAKCFDLEVDLDIMEIGLPLLADEGGLPADRLARA